MPPYGWPSVDGRPDDNAHWLASGAIADKQKAAFAVACEPANQFDPMGMLPSGMSYKAAIDEWTRRILGRTDDLAEKARRELAQFVAPPHFNQSEDATGDRMNRNDEEVIKRLRAAVAMIAASPSFQFR